MPAEAGGSSRCASASPASVTMSMPNRCAMCMIAAFSRRQCMKSVAHETVARMLGAALEQRAADAAAAMRRQHREPELGVIVRRAPGARRRRAPGYRRGRRTPRRDRNRFHRRRRRWLRRKATSRTAAAGPPEAARGNARGARRVRLRRGVGQRWSSWSLRWGRSGLGAAAVVVRRSTGDGPRLAQGCASEACAMQHRWPDCRASATPCARSRGSAESPWLRTGCPDRRHGDQY